MLYYLVATLYVLTCFLLILVVLLQQGKGGDIANAFGGGASQAAFGARSGATVLSRATTVLAVLFVVGAIVLGIMGQRGPGSVLGGRSQAGAPGPLGDHQAGSAANTRHHASAGGTGHSGTGDASSGDTGTDAVTDARQHERPSSRKWRNWQTHQLEGLAVAIPWGFESPLPHHTNFVGVVASGRFSGARPKPSALVRGHESPLRTILIQVSYALGVTRDSNRT